MKFLFNRWKVVLIFRVFKKYFYKFLERSLTPKTRQILHIRVIICTQIVPVLWIAHLPHLRPLEFYLWFHLEQLIYAAEMSEMSIE